ncbi:Gfo/Idh/MocA family oxidoreductase [Shumkonia mesophila]|uniref:Gfo/Idh/MocA family oxidoreductase n=1 Tax=Shumkonia mesophila TaxID=2838854 RepID=UPI00374497B4
MRVVAMCDRNPPKAEATGRSAGAERIYTAPHEMLEREYLDLVIMTVGLEAYPALSEQAMRGGMHVYVEKPPARRSLPCRQGQGSAREHPLRVRGRNHRQKVLGATAQRLKAPGLMLRPAPRFTKSVWADVGFGATSPLVMMMTWQHVESRL